MLPQIFVGYPELDSTYSDTGFDFFLPEYFPSSEYGIGSMMSYEQGNNAILPATINQHRKRYILRELQRVSDNVYQTPDGSLTFDFNIQQLLSINSSQLSEVLDELQRTVSIAWLKDKDEFLLHMEEKFEAILKRKNETNEENTEASDKGKDKEKPESIEEQEVYHLEDFSLFLANAIVKEQNRRLLHAIGNSEKLDQIYPNLRELLVEHITAAHTIQVLLAWDVANQYQEVFYKKYRNYLEKRCEVNKMIEKQYPIRSRIPSWRNARESKEMEEFIKSEGNV